MTELTLNICIPLPPKGNRNVFLGRVERALAAAYDPTIRILDFGAPEEFVDPQLVTAAPTQTDEPPGWEGFDVRAMILSLPANQRDVIQAAIKNGGLINRDETYAVIGRSQKKRLTGFTRPVDKATAYLKKNGKLRQDVKDLLATEYKGSGRAYAFRVPDEVVQRWKQTA